MDIRDFESILTVGENVAVEFKRKRLIFRYYQKNIRLLFSSRSTLTIHI